MDGDDQPRVGRIVLQLAPQAAHQHIDLKPIPYIENPFPEGEREVAERGDDAPVPTGPNGLTQEAEDIMLNIGEELRSLPPLTGEKLADASGLSPTADSARDQSASN